MIRKSIALASMLIIFLFLPLLVHTRGAVELPDLRIRQNEFVSTNNKGLRVQIANHGKAASKPC